MEYGLENFFNTVIASNREPRMSIEEVQQTLLNCTHEGFYPREIITDKFTVSGIFGVNFTGNNNICMVMCNTLVDTTTGLIEKKERVKIIDVNAIIDIDI